MILLLSFISYHAPEDSCSIWMMDMLLAFPQMIEDSIFFSDKHGIRYIAGCLDLYKWYQDLGIRGKTEVGKGIDLGWEMRNYRNYNDSVNYLLFSVEKKNFFVYTTASYLKKRDELGVGFKIKGMEVRVGIPHVFQNFAYDRTSERGRESMRYYTPMPVGFYLRTLVFSPVALYSETYLIPKMRYRIGDVYYTESYLRGRGRIEIPFFGFFFYGYMHKREDFTISECFLIPYISFNIAGHSIRLEYGWERKISEDTTSYRRVHRSFSIYHGFRIFYFGFQRTWRERWINGNKYASYGDTRTRFLLGIRFRMKEGAYFEIVEGLRPDAKRIEDIHYHTYLKFIYSF